MIIYEYIDIDCQYDWRCFPAIHNRNRLYWVNSLRPNGASWPLRYGWTLAQVMAGCLATPSQYLNQCRIVISEILWHSYGAIFAVTARQPFSKMSFEIIHSNLLPHLKGTNDSVGSVCWIHSLGQLFFSCISKEWSPSMYSVKIIYKDNDA